MKSVFNAETRCCSCHSTALLKCTAGHPFCWDCVSNEILALGDNAHVLKCLLSHCSGTFRIDDLESAFTTVTGWVDEFQKNRLPASATASSALAISSSTSFAVPTDSVPLPSTSLNFPATLPLAPITPAAFSSQAVSSDLLSVTPVSVLPTPSPALVEQVHTQVQPVVHSSLPALSEHRRPTPPAQRGWQALPGRGGPPPARSQHAMVVIGTRVYILMGRTSTKRFGDIGVFDLGMCVQCVCMC